MNKKLNAQDLILIGVLFLLVGGFWRILTDRRFRYVQKSI